MKHKMSVKVGTRESTHHRNSSTVPTYSSSMAALSSVDVHRHLSDGSMSQNVYSNTRTRKAKRIRFLCNGDKFYKGIVIPVTPERYRSFDSLLNDLTRLFSGSINLPNGVRMLFTMDGNKIFQLDELEDGKYYICAGKGEQFKRVDYLVLSSSCNTIPGPGRVRPSSSLIKLPAPNSNNNNGNTMISSYSGYSSSNCNNSNSNNSNNVYLTLTNSIIGSQNSSVSSSKSSNCVIRPRIVILVRNGNRPRRVLRLLLNKRNAPSFDHALSTITDTVKLDTGAVRKVFNSKGVQIYQLEDFFGEEDVFFVYGSERVNQDDFGLDFEELRAVQTHKKELRRPVTTELKNGTHCMDESGKAVPKLPFTSKRMKNVKQQFETNLTIPSNVLSRYTVGPIVGDGNFAVVRKCTDRLKNIDYALKVIDKEKVIGKEQMILNELSILKGISHPNIIQFVAELDTPNELYLIMEFVSGGDLFDAISKRVKFSEDDAQIVTHNLASALSYLHSKSIVHRDIKPENLLLEIAGDRIKQLKVADFGLAQLVTEPLYAVCGTPTYVAPEVLMEIGYGLQIDVWAAGVILYILLCGFPPFVSSNNNQEELFVDILSGEYGFPSPFWDEISNAAKDLISNMIQPNPSLRFSAEDVLEHPWISSE